MIMIFLRYNWILTEASCYILAGSQQRVAPVVDPGAGSAEWIGETLTSRRLNLGGVLCTHGYIDHVWDSGPIIGEAPAYVPSPDLYRMEDPVVTGPAAVGVLPEASGRSWIRPKGAAALPRRFFEDEGGQIMLGVVMRVVPAPGYTEGSCAFLLSGKIDSDRESVIFPEDVFGEKFVLGGDMLSRDGVRRTNLPGGDPVAAVESLRALVGVIDLVAVFSPGRSPSSTMGRGKECSRYLKLAISGEMA